jgi:hypothetical protein
MNVILDGLRIGESPRWHDGRLAATGVKEIVAVTPEG